MSGADLKTIMEVGGWQQLKMVERYAHVIAEHKARAIGRISVEFPNAIHNAEITAIEPAQESVG